MIRRYLLLALAAGVAALVVIVPLLISLNSRPGPPAIAPATPAASPTASPTRVGPSNPVPLSGEQLVRPGQNATIDAVDDSGVWGSIELTRGEDTGGYPNYPVSADVFVIEVLVEYRAERLPDLVRFGRHDWKLVTANDGEPIGRFIYPPVTPNPAETYPDRHPLGAGYPGAVDVVATVISGMLYFEVSRAAADQALVLLYRPQGFNTAVIGIALHEPGIAPGPVPTSSPVPTPFPGYVFKEGLPFTVIESVAADALFDSPDTCINDVDGYRLTYPDSWYTNTQFGSVPPCSWFSPTYYEVQFESDPPDEIVIFIRVFDGGYGYYYLPTLTVDEVIAIDGFEGWRREEIGGCFKPEGCRALLPRYEYVANLGGKDAIGPTLLAGTSSDGVPSYELNKAVLDRIMASLEFLP